MSLMIARISGWKFALILLTLALGLTGCMPSSEKPEQMVQDGTVILSPGSPLGQTFTAHYDGLQGVWVYLDNPGSTGAGEIIFHLRASPQDAGDLRRSVLPAGRITRPAFYRFSFAPLEASNQSNYYALLELNGSGTLKVSTSQGDNYLNGALYRAGQAQDAQLTFGLSYHTAMLYTGLLAEGMRWIGWLLAGVWLFIIPGWALLAWLWPGWERLYWIEKLGLAGGLSLALYPLLFLWSDLAGLHLGPLYAWLPPLCGLLAMGWRIKTLKVLKTLRVSDIKICDVALVLLLGLVFAVRLWVVRNLAIPMWGDSYQHTVMAQLLVDHGGLFDSWRPYAELTTFTYHFGFHTLAAAYHWVSGMGLPQSVLYTGQIVNGLAIIALVPLAMRIQRSHWTALAALLLAGLLSPMPMSYTNWGRYTQLAGLAILPVTMYLIWSVLEKPLPRRKAIIPVWLALSGLGLTHYRMLVFALLFYAAFALLNLRRLPLRALAKQMLWTGSGAALLFLPWLVHIFAGQVMTIFSHQVTTLPAQLSEAAQAYNAPGELYRYLPYLAWLSLPVWIGWGLWRRNREMALILLWWWLVVLAANPQWLGLPGSGALTNFAVLISIYLPATLVAAPACAWTLHSLRRLPATRKMKVPAWLLPATLTILILLAGAWGAQQRRQDIQIAVHSLATPADQRAARWIEANLPGESRLLVNSFFAYGDSAIVGSDGGWWLPLLAHRLTTLPPLPYTSEQGPRPAYREWVNALTAAIQARGIDDPQTLHMFAKRGVTHVYIGQQQGRVNSTQSLLEPAALQASAHYRAVYHEDRVWVFEIIPSKGNP